ncbi:ferritin-like domain-containing protein [Sporosarcina obsidiansis]|uniref:ferritin-like domain-containing protein n=1 Tax=Sporosarcina obsidiansis TaxID=2660748 RepID=UPI001E5948BE|nr:ferritin-like domain-containing protein [Sporosarcina obsidiansis]
MQNTNQVYPNPNIQTINNLLKAMHGEYHAIYCYEILANQAPTQDIKNKILEIRNDEMRHYQTFWVLYFQLTGKEPEIKLTEGCAKDYMSGVKAAFMDEQATVDFYHEAARKTTNPIISSAFTQASADEQNHAVWFLYFLNHS